MSDVRKLAEEAVALAGMATQGPMVGRVEPTQAAPECDDVDLHAYVRDSKGREVAFVPERYEDEEDYEATAQLFAHAGTHYAEIARALVAALDVVEAAEEMADASNAFEGEPTIIAPREPDAQTLRIVRAIAGTVKAVTAYREGK